MRIVQFHSGAGPGDAITQGMWLVDRLLKSLGHDTAVFAEHIAPEISHRISHLHNMDIGPDDVLIYRHSMGHDSLDRILSSPARKILWYHNITPAKYFTNSAFLAQYAEKGRDQLRSIVPACKAFVADSSYNAEELTGLTDDDIRIIPALVDFDRLREIRPDFSLSNRFTGRINILTVGRVAPNKGHIRCLRILRQLLTTYPQLEGKLFWTFVGSVDLNDPYWSELNTEMQRLKLSLGRHVDFTGKVSDQALRTFYGNCDVLATLSEHEGFCVPIVESYYYGLPVLALGSGAIPETVGAGGVLLNYGSRDVDIVNALARLVQSFRARSRIRRRQYLELERYHPNSLREQLAEVLSTISPTAARRGRDLPVQDRSRIDVVVRGPAESNYSLALVNRGLARGLKEEGMAVASEITEGPGDYPYDLEAVRRRPNLAAMVEKSRGHPSNYRWSASDMWPPRYRDARAHYNAAYFFWEESAIPEDIVRDMNFYLDLVLCPSEFVQKTLRNNGLTAPTAIVGSGIDFEVVEAAQSGRARMPAGATALDPSAFVLLHVSSLFPRKGASELLEGFLLSLEKRDYGQCLYIKSFRNPHNADAIDTILRARKRVGASRIILDLDELDPGEMAWLLQRCSAVISATRGEGFGLPLLEGMIFGKHVIAPQHSALLDLKLPASGAIKSRLATAQTHLSSREASLWFEADVGSIADRIAMANNNTNVPANGAAPTRQSGWQPTSVKVQKALTAAETFGDAQDRERPVRVAWVSTFGIRCGISEMSRSLVRSQAFEQLKIRVFCTREERAFIDDGIELEETWFNRDDPSLEKLSTGLLDYAPDVAVIQFNFGFFDPPKLVQMIRELKAAGIQTVLQLHALFMPNEDDHPAALLESSLLTLVDRIIVHSVRDANVLLPHVNPNNVVVLPLPVSNDEVGDPTLMREVLGVPVGVPLLATYGFLLPGKGLENALVAFRRILDAEPAAHLLMLNARYPNPVSDKQAAELENIICGLRLQNNVTLIDDFLEDIVSRRILNAVDAVLFLYSKTQESASAAVRTAIGVGKPIIVSKAPIFEALSDLVTQVDLDRPETIASIILRILRANQGGSGARSNLAEREKLRQTWLAENSLSNISRRYARLINGVAAEGRQIAASEGVSQLDSRPRREARTA